MIMVMKEMAEFIKSIPEENFEALRFPELDNLGPRKVDTLNKDKQGDIVPKDKQD